MEVGQRLGREMWDVIMGNLFGCRCETLCYESGIITGGWDVTGYMVSGSASLRSCVVSNVPYIGNIRAVLNGFCSRRCSLSKHH